MDEPEFRPISAQPSAPVKKNKTKLIIAIIIILFLLGGFFLFQRANNSAEEEVIEEQIIIPTEETSPTPDDEDVTPTIEEEEEEDETPTPIPTTGAVSSRFELNVQVLNGSGEGGVAGEAQTFLQDLGYETVVTGNGDNFNYEGVTVNIKSSRSKYLDDIVSDLEDKYTVNEETGTLGTSSGFDVTIIIGS
ncbi:MAG: LytR C-terminal domain-containing protein [Patescibacteria group bacterium]